MTPITVAGSTRRIKMLRLLVFLFQGCFHTDVIIGKTEIYEGDEKIGIEFTTRCTKCGRIKFTNNL